PPATSSALPATEDRMIWSHTTRPAALLNGALLIPVIFIAIFIAMGGAGRASAAEAPLAPPQPALLRILFEPADAALGQAAREDLVAFANDFRKRSGRLEIDAYAGPPHDASSAARRLALRRALSVRRELMTNGVTAERIQVRALGGTSDSGPPDRVDIKLYGG
ncbi:MAG: OmpA family protein, partial [Parvibaculum sp.]|nr:OmpA family protein [Parvibaculum sp.]